MSPSTRLLSIAVALVACQAQPAADPPGKSVAPPPVEAAVPARPTPAAKPAPAPDLPPAIAPLAGDGERAFISDDSGLVEVALTGTSQVITPSAIEWCSVDARGKVVWFVTEQGLRAFDLVDRRIRPILDADLSDIEILIDWGDQKLGGEDPLEFDVGAALHLTSAPAIRTVMGCDGDRAVYCFEEDGKTPRPEVKKSQQDAAALKLLDPAYLASIAARGATGSLWSPPPVPPATPAKKPAVSRKPCTEAPEDCGTLTAIPSSPLWLVVTGNGRGDYFHESRELWDPRTGEFLQPQGAKLVRSKRVIDPDAGGDYGGLRVSNGTLTYEGAVFDDTKIIFTPKDADVTPSSCGFTGGGWRIPGPTG